MAQERYESPGGLHLGPLSSRSSALTSSPKDPGTRSSVAARRQGEPSRESSSSASRPASWIQWDGMGWDGMGWDGMGWDGMGWDGMG
jgi:hypothetical protein